MPTFAPNSVNKRMMMQHIPPHIPWELIIKYFKQRCSAAEHDELMQWAAQPEERALLEELQQLWEQITTRSAHYTPDKAYYWEELTRRLKLYESHEAQPAQIRGRGLRKVLYRVSVAACLLLAVGLAFFLGSELRSSDPIEQVYTCMSGKSCVSLPDGTKVWLHQQTTLRLAPHFLKQERSVELTGEAYFEVARNEQKPFVVQTDGLEVAVHGTKFNVDAPSESPECRVSLLEGSISLLTPLQHLFLQPGQSAVYNRNSQQISLDTEADLHYATVWTRQRLSLRDATLGQVCRYLSKWYGVPIHLADPQLASSYKFTFTLRTEQLEEVLRLMSRIHPIAYHFDEHNRVTITPLQPTSQKR